jgi:LuxR family maltose regulon positive regulatory protein
MERLLDWADGASADPSEEAFEPTTGKAGSLLVNVPAMLALQRSYLAQLRNDAAGTAAFADEAQAHLGHDDEMSRVAIEGFFGVGEWLCGRLAEAEQGFVSNTSRWRDAGHLSGAAWAAYSLARLQRAQGRLDAAHQTCRQALEFATVPGRPPMPAAGPAFVGLAEVAYQRNELDAALQLVSEGIACAACSCTARPSTLGW